MDLENIKWNKTTYRSFINFLKTFSDDEYKKFHKKILGKDDVELLGIRTPKQKEIAKKIAKGDYKSFIKYNNHKFYEENMIHGLILGYIKIEEDELLKLFDEFMQYIDNWAICDTVCANLKQFKKININKIDKYLKSNNPWTNRVGLVLLLNYYIKEENLNYIFNTCNNIKKDHYYVKMAKAWLLSLCYIKYPEMTLKYLKNNKLDQFTQNKAISKICDSYRITKIDKEKLKMLKI